MVQNPIITKQQKNGENNMSAILNQKIFMPIKKIKTDFYSFRKEKIKQIYKQHIKNQLEIIENLKDGWDIDDNGDDCGKKIPETEISWFKKNILEEIWDWEGLPKTYLFPLREGGLQLYWKVDKKTTANFECHIRQQTWLFFINNGNFEESKLFDRPFSGSDHLELLKKYLIIKK